MNISKKRKKKQFIFAQPKASPAEARLQPSLFTCAANSVLTKSVTTPLNSGSFLEKKQKR
jgi:hypothetical protein